MKIKTEIICTGCDKNSSSMDEYDDDNRVEDDGTYAFGRFVCTPCYSKLISIGQDIGSPLIIQRRAALIKELSDGQ